VVEDGFSIHNDTAHLNDSCEKKAFNFGLASCRSLGKSEEGLTRMLFTRSHQENRKLYNLHHLPSRCPMNQNDLMGLWEETRLCPIDWGFCITNIQ
jgi:hypothetical protein